MTRDAASQAQVDAARPYVSTWLAANAGSGKTRVLTDRVARLLLEGVLPEHILCLTYTKAAATEMQNRLFKRLGGWAMLNADALHAELMQLGVEHRLTPEFLRDARTLFARAIETPGGLRIQTIHSFCATLLRRFPLEARVSPQFQEMEDRAAQLLRIDVLDGLADGPDASLVQAIAPFVVNDDTDALLAEITHNKGRFEAGSVQDLRQAYGLSEQDSQDTLLSEVFLGGEMDLLAKMRPVLETSGANDQKLASVITQLTGPDLASLIRLEQILLFGATSKAPFAAKIGSIPTKGLLKKHPMDDLMPGFENLMGRIEEAREKRLGLAALQKDLALFHFARAYLPAYEAEKQRRGWLDFDDLIIRARDLLQDPSVAEWVLFRLDGGIDHILVDEAQDTSPVQWQVIERLAQEFTSGQGARTDTPRTIFVVGDKKQSIYSFQGANPLEFDRMRDHFRDRLQTTDSPLSDAALEFSFRSAEPILRLVDTTFMNAAESGFTAEQKHRAFKDHMPGRVDLWPVVEAVKEDEDGPWYEPLDRTSAGHHTALLAQRIATFIDQTIAAKTPLPIEIGQSGTYEARPVHAGDFLILVKSRGRLFSEIIRACKQRGLPIAGADRLKVMAELAVRDIIALLSFLSTPEDDLALGTVLRSPLFGVSEQDLFDLAHRRTRKYLWEALRDRRDEFPAVLNVIDDLRGQTDFLRPYDLIDRILTRHDGRRLLIGRLGQEAEDGIDALLGQALAYEQTDIPSLTGFLEWAQADDLQIKRAPDSAGTTLRVMTVHGAKGLEAPIVILPDCAEPKRDVRAQVLTDTAGPLWKQSASQQPARQRAAMDIARDKQARERDRLLYVAMTRAEKWLVVAAAGSLGKQGDAWYEQIRRGMDGAGAVPLTYDFDELGSGEGLALGDRDWSDLTMIDAQSTPDAPADLPAALTHASPEPQIPPATRSPSDLGGAKALSGADGDTEERALARGTVVHNLLEWLAPIAPDQRADYANQITSALIDQIDVALILDLLPDIQAEALNVLSKPDLMRFWSADSLAEVPVTADIPGIGRIHGVIDRLVITDSQIWAVDFKSNRAVPENFDTVPEGLLRQMGAYLLALQQLYPGHHIETGLIWTKTATYMPLPHDLVTQSVARAAGS